MAIADPKDYAVPKILDDEGDLRAQVAALQAMVRTLMTQQSSGGGITADQLETIMLRMAKAQSEALREAAEKDQRDDLNFPRISVFSYPEGDTKRPRPAFKCKMLWSGYDLDWDTTSAAEVEAVNLAEPGDFTFRRIGGQLEKLTVEGERAANGKLTKLSFTFPVKENRDTLPSMLSMLRDAYGIKTPEQLEIEQLRAQVAQLTATQPVSA